MLPSRNSLPALNFSALIKNFCAFQLPTLPDQSLHASIKSIFSPAVALKYLNIFNSEYPPVLAVSYLAEIVITDIFCREYLGEDVNRDEIPGKKLGLKLGREVIQAVTAL